MVSEKRSVLHHFGEMKAVNTYSSHFIKSAWIFICNCNFMELLVTHDLAELDHVLMGNLQLLEKTALVLQTNCAASWCGMCFAIEQTKLVFVSHG